YVKKLKTGYLIFDTYNNILLKSTVTGSVVTTAIVGGGVQGPASSVNNRVAFFDGTTGMAIKDNGISLTGNNTGDQTITLTGDVTGTGTGSFAATIANGAVSLAKMASMATSAFLGRNTAGSGA